MFMQKSLCFLMLLFLFSRSEMKANDISYQITEGIVDYASISNSSHGNAVITHEDLVRISARNSGIIVGSAYTTLHIIFAGMTFTADLMTRSLKTSEIITDVAFILLGLPLGAGLGYLVEYIALKFLD